MLGGDEGGFGIVAGGRWWGVRDEVEGGLVRITEDGVRVMVGGVGVVGVVLWGWQAGVVVGWKGAVSRIIGLEGRFAVIFAVVYSG